MSIHIQAPNPEGYDVTKPVAPSDVRDISHSDAFTLSADATGVDYEGNAMPVVVACPRPELVGWVVMNVWPPVTPKYATLEDAKAMAVQYATAFEQHVTGPVSLGEQLSYNAKEQAAKAHLAGTATTDETDLLSAEASLTGETLDQLAQKIVDNAAVFRAVAGSVAGLRRATVAALEAVTDPHQYETVLQTALAQADALAVSLGLTPLPFDE